MADTRISDVEDFDESLDDGDDSEYDYTGEESNLEEGAVEERCRFDWQDDFLFVLTAFFAATFAAFYTILSETGVPP